MKWKLGQNSEQFQNIIFPSFLNSENPLFFSFRVDTVDGSAKQGEDYVPIREVLTFAPFENERKVGSIGETKRIKNHWILLLSNKICPYVQGCILNLSVIF